MTTVTKSLLDTGPPYLVFGTCALSPDETVRDTGAITACQAWMSSPGAFRARTLVWRVAALVSERAREAASGLSSPVLLASYDRELSSWRTLQLSLPGMEPSLLATLPRWGTLHHGALSQQPTPEPPTSESGGGASRWTTPVLYDATPGGPNNHYLGLGNMAKHNKWPTPQRRDYRSGDDPNSPRMARKLAQGWSFNLNDVARWGTPMASDYKGTGPVGSQSHDHDLGRKYLRAQATDQGGALNPEFVESLMGFPIGWTEVD